MKVQIAFGAWLPVAVAQLETLGFISVMDKIISGLVLAAFSGLTFVAYRHPRSYEKLYGYVLVGLLFVYCVLVSYGFGYYVGHHHKDDVEWPFSFSGWWLYYGFWFVIGYVFLLAHLPDLLKHDKPDKNQEPDDEA